MKRLRREDMVPSTWDPQQYERFQAERSQPFFDLMALVQHRPGMRVVDLGCGTGELTRTLHERLGAQETLGVDNSKTMLAKSGALAGNGLRFVQGDIAAFAADPANRRSAPDHGNPGIEAGEHVMSGQAAGFNPR